MKRTTRTSHDMTAARGARLARAAGLAMLLGATPFALPAQEAAAGAASTKADAPAKPDAPAKAAKEEPEAAAMESALPGVTPDGLPSLDDLIKEPPPPAGDLAQPRADVAATPTGNAVVNLIQKLVQKGILTQAEAGEMVQQAEREAAVARQSAAATALLAADASMATGNDVVVTHIPDPVKERMREEIKQDLMAAAKEEKWGGGGPSWADKIKFSGDLRLRYDGTFFPDGNDNTGSFPDFNKINTGDPFDVAGTDFSPQLNVDEERERMRLRARAGAEMNIDNGFTVGMRIATGNDSSPVSTNQTMGSSGGDFSKYSLWLDRAFLKWESGGDPSSNLAILGGRFDNPFFRASELMWDNDLGFDGLAFQARQKVWDGITPFLNAGAFPIYNTDFNFASNNPDKYSSTDKWLYGVQFGVDLKKDKDLAAKLGVAWYEFDNVEGKLSDPFLPLSAKDAGNTDSTRPSFAQKGNTYMALRNILSDPLNDYGTSKQYQYFGLASKFQVLAYNAKVDFNFWEPVQISLLGEYATNLAYDQEKIEAVAVNNRGSVPEGSDYGSYDGGDTAWSLGVQFGHGAMQKAWDWKATLGYRYVESDAVVDGFADSDFGLGGTNMEGFTVGASLAVAPNVFFALRWMAANEIAGPPVKSDVLQFDINATF